MTRPSLKPAALLASLWPALLGAPATHAQATTPDAALEQYLESRELEQLLIAHLESRMRAAPSAERGALAERLARLYAERLDQAQSGQERAELERRARALLSEAPDAESIDLRLSLARGSYARAERLAEQWRLRIATAEEAAEAERVFRTLAGELSTLGAQAHRRVEGYTRLEESARAGDPEALGETIADARRRRSLAMYLAGWSLTYLAELTNDAASAQEAMTRFGWLLNAEPGARPALDSVPRSSLRLEHVARAAIGVATDLSIMGQADEALRWLDMVEATEELDPAVREQIFPRRATVLARAARWTELLALTNREREASSGGSAPLAPAHARLLAMLSLDLPAGGQGASRDALRQVAMADLIAAGDVGQVLDLATRYGLEPLGSAGFVGDYVRGLLAFRAAQRAHATSSDGDTNSPTTDAAVAAQYAAAADSLRLALQDPQASEHPAALRDALLLRATARFLAAGRGNARQLREIAQLFITAANELDDDPARQAQAIWAGIRALRLAVERAPEAEATDLRERLDALTAEFIDRFPADARAGSLLLEQAQRGSLPRSDAIAALLATPEESAAHQPAQAQAARLLFQDWTQTKSTATARRFLEVAQPLLLRERAAALAEDASARERAMLLARQILAVALEDASADIPLASLAAATLRELLDQQSAAADPGVRAELLFREVQVAVAEGRPDRAMQAYAELRSWGAAPEQFIDAARRLLYRDAAERWRRSPRDVRHAERVLSLGGQIISSAGGDESLRDPAVLAVYVTVGDAAAAYWRETGDQDALSLARSRLRVALRAQPNSRAILERVAMLAEEQGDVAEARWALERLLGGSEVGSDAWFRTKLDLLRVLRPADPDAARLMLERHFAIFSEGGPEEWGAQFRELQERWRGNRREDARGEPGHE